MAPNCRKKADVAIKAWKTDCGTTAHISTNKRLKEKVLKCSLLTEHSRREPCSLRPKTAPYAPLLVVECLQRVHYQGWMTWGGPLVLKANSGARRVASEDLPFSQMILPKVFVGKITWYQFLLIPAYTFSFFIILWVVWWGNNAYYHSASIPEKTGTRENWYASLLSILLTWAKHILRYRTTWSHGMPYMNSTPLLRPLRVSFHTF